MSFALPRMSYASTSRPTNVPPSTLSGNFGALRTAPTERTLPKDVSSRFGSRLRELRRERNMTQLRMATDFGIDRSFISDVERGRKSISLPMLEVIALGMRVSLSDLLRDL